MPVAFRGDDKVRNARAFFIDTGLDSATQAAVEVDGGLLLTPVAWGYENVHASDAEPRPATLESLTMDAGALVAVVGRTEGVAPRGEATEPEMVLVRAVLRCQLTEPVACRLFAPPADDPVLGSKRKPWGAATPWAAIPWDRVVRFGWTPAGTLRVN